MTFKEFIISRVQVFFLLTTLILAASAVLGCFIAPGQELRYYHLFTPMIIAALCVLPTFVTYFRKEPTVKQYILRELIELAMIEGIVLFLVKPPAQFAENRIIIYVLLGGVVLVIYLLVELMMWLKKSQESKELTSLLKKLQENE